MDKPDFINKKVFCMSLVLMGALAMKLIYPSTSTGDLKFMLQPTAELVSAWQNHHYVYSESGFWFPALHIIIEKSCSGFNFLIICLCVFATIFPYQLFALQKLFLMIPLLVVITFVLTIAVNTSRIVVAIFLLRLEPQMPWITEPWVHEAEGALVYLFALLGFYLLATRLINKLTLYYEKRSQSLVAAVH